MFKYGDILKAGTDLLTKRYKYERKVKVETKSRDGVKFTSEGKLAGKGFDGILKAEYEQGNLKLNKLELSTAGKVAGELTLKGLADGVELSFKAEEGLRTSGTISAGVLGGSYTADAFRVDADVDLINGPTLAAAAITKYEGFLVGGHAKFNVAPKEGADGLEDFGFALGYDGADFRAAATTTGKLAGVNVGLHHAVDANVAVAAGVSFALPSKDGGETDPWTLAVGGSYKLGADSDVQAKFSSDGTIAANYQAKLNTCATLTLAASVDAANLGGDKHQLGLTLGFSG
uniref:Porin domain-containing protein n=1 Tax=Bicosoecida sp. CB-2014 TaxID=1486930 RepID=A0A7S1C8S9_9STRA|mmetsp:Transcript_17857/g.63014  ORF Transcript_17857/g.63014 Transcript_17857/m.63014 type:complete len:288 (+) Transcript_17857:123-986(+)